MQARIDELQARLKAKKDEEYASEEFSKSRSAGSENETVSDGDDDYVDDLPVETNLKQKARGPRAAVSAEVFGAWNKKSAFEPKVFEKSPEQAI